MLPDSQQQQRQQGGAWLHPDTKNHRSELNQNMIIIES